MVGAGIMSLRFRIGLEVVLGVGLWSYPPPLLFVCGQRYVPWVYGPTTTCTTMHDNESPPLPPNLASCLSPRYHANPHYDITILTLSTPLGVEGSD